MTCFLWAVIDNQPCDRHLWTGSALGHIHYRGRRNQRSFCGLKSLACSTPLEFLFCIDFSEPPAASLYGRFTPRVCSHSMPQSHMMPWGARGLGGGKLFSGERVGGQSQQYQQICLYIICVCVNVYFSNGSIYWETCLFPFFLRARGLRSISHTCEYGAGVRVCLA